MNDKIIITICRQFCSGGLRVGKGLSKKIGAHFYDKELISLAAKESGFSENIFKGADEKPTRSLLYSLAMGSTGISGAGAFFQNNDFLTNDKLFGIQSSVIKEIAEQKSAVIVGRCSDYILREHKNIVRVYLRADDEFRIKNLLEEKSDLTKKEAGELLHKTDKKRRHYYNYYTGNEWNDVNNYDIVINTSKVGIDGAIEQIIKYINSMEKHSN